MNIRHIFVAVLSFLLVSCGNNKLNTALRYAGDNRPELEKVLTHFAGDKLKLEAARYLIENMPGHSYYTDEDCDGYFAKVDSLYPRMKSYFRQVLYCMPEEYLPVPDDPKEDIHHIKAGFLISHIDRSFERWAAAPWKNEVTFEAFRKYILPYRIGKEPLDYIEKMNHSVNIDSLNRRFADYTLPMSLFHEYYTSQLFRFPEQNIGLPYPVSGNFIYDCKPLALLFHLEYKLAGIPCAVDFTPCWARRSNGHYWNALIDFHLKHVPIKEYYNNFQCSKVYRQTYHKCEIPESNGKDFIPALFLNPFKEDVTELYARTTDLKLPLNIKGNKTDHVYLCVFNNLDWQPVACGNVKRGNGHFQKISVGNIYWPMYYRGEERISAGYPFYLTPEGAVREMIPQKNRVTFSLKRKFNVHVDKFQRDAAVQGVMFIGLNRKMEEKEEIYKIEDLGTVPFFKTAFDEKKYRYVKICSNSPSRYYCSLAEVKFTDAAGNECKPARLLSADGSDNKSAAVLFDGNVLSTYQLTKEVIVDLGKEVPLTGIEFISINDDNYINAGEEYELFYHDDKTWVPIGRKTATDRIVTFDNVPSGAVYWLRNRTKGKEERIFTYENNKPVFW